MTWKLDCMFIVRRIRVVMTWHIDLIIMITFIVKLIGVFCGTLKDINALSFLSVELVEFHIMLFLSGNT